MLLNITRDLFRARVSFIFNEQGAEKRKRNRHKKSLQFANSAAPNAYTRTKFFASRLLRHLFPLCFANSSYRRPIICQFVAAATMPSTKSTSWRLMSFYYHQLDVINFLWTLPRDTHYTSVAPLTSSLWTVVSALLHFPNFIDIYRIRN